MAEETTKVPGAHYSGKNKIPTVNQFLERLDKDKRDRDRQLDEHNKAAKSAATNGEAKPHVNEDARVRKNQKKVWDPTTQREVVIEDVNKETIEHAKNPVVCGRNGRPMRSVAPD